MSLIEFCTYFYNRLHLVGTLPPGRYLHQPLLLGAFPLLRHHSPTSCPSFFYLYSSYCFSCQDTHHFRHHHQKLQRCQLVVLSHQRRHHPYSSFSSCFSCLHPRSAHRVGLADLGAHHHYLKLFVLQWCSHRFQNHQAAPHLFYFSCLPSYFRFDHFCPLHQNRFRQLGFFAFSSYPLHLLLPRQLQV